MPDVDSTKFGAASSPCICRRVSKETGNTGTRPREANDLVRIVASFPMIHRVKDLWVGFRRQFGVVMY